MINRHPSSKICSKCGNGRELKDSKDPLLYMCLKGCKVGSNSCNKFFTYCELECDTNCDNCEHPNCK